MNKVLACAAIRPIMHHMSEPSHVRIYPRFVEAIAKLKKKHLRSFAGEVNAAVESWIEQHKPKKP